MAKLKLTYPALRQPSNVTFGSGSLRTLAQCGPLNRTALLLSATPAVLGVVDGVLRRAETDLERVPHLVKPPGEPTAEMILEGADWLNRQSFDRLVAIGGGSVLDWARLSWAHSQGLLTLDSGRVKSREAASHRPELWLVPTTCGTGAEAAAVAVYTVQGRKTPAVSPAFIADQVVLDGHFMASVEPGDLACSLADAMSHAIEGFVSIVPIHLAKEAALSALQIIWNQYNAEPGTCRNERLMEAGYLGGVAAANCSVGVVHALAHGLSAWGVSHGLGNAVGLLPGIRINAGTEAMGHLISRLGLTDINQLVARVEPIVQTAIKARLQPAIVERLQSTSDRRELAQSMADDVCLRTNPRTLSPGELDAFLSDVAKSLLA